MIIISTLTYVGSIIALLVVLMFLVAILLACKSILVPSGDLSIVINGDDGNPITTGAGGTILSTLSNQGIFLPSACGGGGTCAMCKCQVFEGGGEILPTEAPYFNRAEIKDNWRLGCQVKVKNDMKIGIPEEIFGIKEYKAKVVSNYNVATYIKEFVIEIPEDMDYEAGGYIQINIPPCEVKFSDFDVTAHPVDHEGEPNKYVKDYTDGAFKMDHLVMKNEEEVIRAYSMASYPAEGRNLMLNVRVAAPPWDRDKNTWADINPGIASSYIFNCKPGDEVTVSGPYGEFFIKDTGKEMLYIGGGAGMAPMRSHLYQLFKTIKTGRKVNFWYGGRSRRELFYLEHFRSLEREYPNFKFHLVLSDALEEDNWIEKKDVNDKDGDGFVGFVHNAVIDQYLSKHEAPEEIELYFCGPPMMNQAVLKMADDWGIPDEQVSFDDFGG